MALPAVITRFAGNVALRASKYGPTIAIGAGCVGVVAACVIACKNTGKASVAIEQAANQLEELKDFDKNSDKQYIKAHRNAVIDTYKTCAIELVRAYGPAVLIGGASIGCIIFSHRTMVHRLATATAAYAALDEEFRGYRKRVVEYLRSKGDDLFEQGLEKYIDAEEVVDEDSGETHTQEVEKYRKVAKPYGYSQYARLFDDHSALWQDNASANFNLLQGIAASLTNTLRTRGHLFLNEVYDALGLERTPDGARAGWILGKGDDYVSFNLQELENRIFLGGWEPSVWLDFNCCGEIWDLI